MSRCIVCSGTWSCAVEGGEHVRMIVGRGDRGAKTAPDRLAGRSAAADDVQLARVCLQLEHRLASQVAIEHKPPAVCSSRVPLVEGELEPAHVLLPHGGDDVEPVCELGRAVEDSTERADDDVGHSLPVERLQQRVLLAVGVVGDDGRLPRRALAMRVS
jgi:hypothetical protein